MIFERIKTPGIAHVAYLIGNKGEAAVVDPRRDVDEYLTLARKHELTIKYAIETHRTDLPDPSKTAEHAGQLYDAVHTKLLPLGDQTIVLAARKLAPDAAHVNDDVNARKEPPKFNWESWLVLGTIVGGMAAGRLAEGPDAAPADRSGAETGRSPLASAAGGALLMYGARMADGCTVSPRRCSNRWPSAPTATAVPIVFATRASSPVNWPTIVRESASLPRCSSAPKTMPVARPSALRVPSFISAIGAP